MTDPSDQLDGEFGVLWTSGGMRDSVQFFVSLTWEKTAIKHRLTHALRWYHEGYFQVGLGWVHGKVGFYWFTARYP